MNHTTFNSVSVGALCHHRAKGGLQDFANFLFSDFQILFLFLFAETDDVADSSGFYRRKNEKEILPSLYTMLRHWPMLVN